MSKINVNNISDESGAGNNLILANDGTTTIPGGTNRPQIVGYQHGLWTPAPTEGSIKAIVTERNTWSRIGNTVMLCGFVQEFTDRSSSGIRVIGAPYDTSFTMSGSASSSYIATANGGITLCYITYNTNVSPRSEINFLTTSKTKADAWIGPKYSQVNNTNAIYFAVTYLTDDTTWAPINGATITP